MPTATRKSSPKVTRGAHSNRDKIKAGYDKLKAGGKLSFAQQQVIGRAESASLPPHLLLGLTLAGLKEAISSLSDGAAQDDGESVRGRSATLDMDGFTQRHRARVASRTDGLSVCERLQRQGSAEVGVAIVYLSRHLGSTLSTLVDAIENLIASTSCAPGTCFWVRDLSIRQTATRAAKDLERTRDVIASIGHTALLLERSHLVAQSPPLRCAYVVCELAYTSQLSLPFDLLLPDADETQMHLQLIHHFDLFYGTLSGPAGRVVCSRRCSWYQ